MARKKSNVLVNVTNDPVLPIEIWIDNPTQYINEIYQIEGVELVSAPFPRSSSMRVRVDPRYDIDEVASDIRNLLEAEVPDVFKD